MILNKKTSFCYYLFSISNLFAAFGGGLILGKGTDVINYPSLQGGSILAFFIGTIIGLLFLQLIPNKISKFIANFFSIGGGFTSLILFYIYQNYSFIGKMDGTSALIFFLLLSVRFGLWFYSRVMRASIASGNQQSIAWVEFGYYIGMVLGLIIWKFININIGLSAALIIDAIFQFLAGTLDLKSFKVNNGFLDKSENKTQNDDNNNETTLYSSKWCWKLSFSVVFITVGVQVIIFNMAHNVTGEFGSYILATFYFGVAVAAFICNKFKICISWGNKNNLATITTNKKESNQFNFLFFIFILTVSVSAVLYKINLNILINNVFFNNLFICTFVFISAFIYEIISLSLLDRIGYEEKKLGKSDVVMKTYGLMGLSAATGFWILGLMNDLFISSITTMVFCLFFSSIAILKRNSEPDNSVLMTKVQN